MELEHVYAFAPELSLETPKVRHASFFPALFLVRSKRIEGAVLHEVNVFCELCGTNEICEHVRAVLERFGLDGSSPDDIARFYRQWLAPRKRLHEETRIVLSMEIPSREFGRTDTYVVSYPVNPHEGWYTVTCSCKGFAHGGLRKARQNGLLLCTHAAAAVEAVRRSFLAERLLAAIRGERELTENLHLDRYQTNALLVAVATNDDALLETVKRTLEGRARDKEFVRTFFQENLVESDQLENLSRRGLSVLAENAEPLAHAFARAETLPPTEHQKAILEKIWTAEKHISVFRVPGRVLRPQINLQTASQPQAYEIIRTYADKEGFSYRNLVQTDVLPPLPRVRFEIELGLPGEAFEALGLARNLPYSTGVWTAKIPEGVLASDASINVPGTRGVELKTGWAEGRADVLRLLQKVFSRLADLGARANASCGLHVHLDAWNLDKRAVGVYLGVWQALEKRLFAKVVAPSRLGNRFCEFMRTRQFEEALLENPEAFPERAAEIFDQAAPALLDEGRYRTLNATPLIKALERGEPDPSNKAYGTLEVRFLHVPRFGGSRQNPGRIKPESARHAAFLTFLTVHGPYYLAMRGILNPRTLAAFVETLPDLEREVRRLEAEAHARNFETSKPPALSRVLRLMGLAEENMPFEVARLIFGEAPDPVFRSSPEETVVYRIKACAWRTGYGRLVNENREPDVEGNFIRL